MTRQTDPEHRLQLCRKYGLTSEQDAYQVIQINARHGARELLRRGLKAPILIQLGYDAGGMKRLGYSDIALGELGYPVAKPTVVTPSVTVPPEPQAPPPVAAPRGEAEEVRQLLAQGLRAPQLRVRGFTIHHLKKAGCSVAEMQGVGFHFDDLVQICSAVELRRAGYGIHELRRYFSGRDLKSAGYDAMDMRNAGYGIKELLNMGYNENQVKTAGFSINELAREGLTRQTVDRSKMG